MPELGFGFVLETIELFNLSYVSLSNLHQVKIQLFLGNKKDNRKKSRFKMSFFSRKDPSLSIEKFQMLTNQLIYGKFVLTICICG